MLLYVLLTIVCFGVKFWAAYTVFLSNEIFRVSFSEYKAIHTLLFSYKNLLMRALMRENATILGY